MDTGVRKMQGSAQGGAPHTRRGFRRRLHAIRRIPAYSWPETYSRMSLVGTDSGDRPLWKCPHFIRGVRLWCLRGAIFRSRAEFLGIDNLRASG